ncbi:hypothetical protein BC936DRAFT_146188 [Jimgerdemannia flammicorona]|uniref:Uncharacterized protein n=1 Tax=Jimgerdemannia flammicorona TaxID=994334 RepID=A0A433D8W5_9FUNG|nr:hypothetical protein BC936DRAFT_146188 [Jimgerdemannia flammicorona]
MNSLVRLTPVVARTAIIRPVRSPSLARFYFTDAPQKPIGGFRGGRVVASHIKRAGFPLCNVWLWFPTCRSLDLGPRHSSLIGFLIGITIAGGTGYYYLIDEYHVASSLLLNSVEELQSSTNRVRDYARKIETVDKELRKLRESAATVEQLEELRSEMKKLYDGLHIQHLELKTHVWGIEQDVHKLTRNKK